MPPPPPVPPPPFQLPELTKGQALPASIQCSKGDSKEVTVKLVTDHLEQVVRQNVTAGIDLTLHSQEMVRRLVATLDLSLTRHLVSTEYKDGDGENVQESVIISFYRHVSPVIQKGPSCGLAALCMALNLLGHSCDSSLTLRIAQELNFTKQGEMFSAENLLALARHLAPCSGRLLNKNEDIEVKEKQIIDEIMRNNVVLIPYDKDGNNEPCLKSGSKAHWACLTGALLVEDQTSRRYLNEDTLNLITEDLQVPYLFHVKTSGQIWCSDTVLQPTTIFVYAMHGRSIHARLWRLKDVLASNAQLTMLDPRIAENLQDFCVPDDGIECGLSGQVIVLSSNIL